MHKEGYCLHFSRKKLALALDIVDLIVHKNLWAYELALAPVSAPALPLSEISIKRTIANSTYILSRPSNGHPCYLGSSSRAGVIRVRVKQRIRSP